MLKGNASFLLKVILFKLSAVFTDNRFEHLRIHQDAENFHGVKLYVKIRTIGALAHSLPPGSFQSLSQLLQMVKPMKVNLYLYANTSNYWHKGVNQILVTHMYHYHSK